MSELTQIERFVALCKNNDSRNMARTELAKINPADITYEEWVAVGAALHKLFGGSESGLKAWISWSEGFNKPTPLAPATWLGFGPPKENVYQETRESMDATVQFLEALEVQGVNLRAVIAAGSDSCYDRGDTGEYVDRFFAAISVFVGKSMAYWYRRCEIAETALEPFGKMYDTIMDQAPNAGQNGVVDLDLENLLLEHLRHAHRTLAERRKDVWRNLEDEARARRQAAFLAFAVRTWGDVANHRDQRAVRLVEEALEAADATRVDFFTHDECGTDNPVDLSPGGRAEYLRELCTALISHIVRKPADSPLREIGGVAVSLMAYAEAHGLQVAECEKLELERVYSKPRKELQERHAAKPI